ncbi:hypothetical protein [Photobacterium kasasachensis]|uniref:hypothetical protein n=1 Tax=Photobacterium kasasachensis TaxID=2910240 RepID=UPI003D109B8C
MSNSSDKLNPASRAMLVGAILGGTASAANQWKAHQSGEIDTNQLVSTVAKDSLKTGLASGATTYIAEKMAGRPVLSMLTVLSAGAAGLYMMEQYAEKKQNEQ